MPIPTWQERCGIYGDQGPEYTSQQTIRHAMQSEIDQLRAYLWQLEAIAEVASRVSLAWESESDGDQDIEDLSTIECCESLDELKEVLRPWRGQKSREDTVERTAD